MGLYACRDEDDNDRVLTHAGMPDAVDNLGSQAVKTMKNAGMDVPDDGWATRARHGQGDDGRHRTHPGDRASAERSLAR
jgi:hypothetical protein